MKIILLKDVDNLGCAGDTTDVRGGYFRNFLMPRKLAVLSSEGGLRFLEAKRKQSVLKAAREKEQAMEVARLLEKAQCVIEVRVGQEGRLFGSVTNRNVEEELKKQGITIERKRIEFATVHQAGEYKAKIKLHSEVEVALQVTIKGA